ncbi:kunitz trypsin inhibitor 5-like [Silene latifolia]|uniref:kunitz trypsin inhibitor 5-like n=1 Tax=Silene latifolia TaxID=37657 RepID=UPI003D77221D
MSSFLFLASITLVLLSILPPSTAIIVLPVDIDGDFILNGGEYYIIPITTTSGFTYTQKHKECPLYITPEKTENSPGTPVKINVAISATIVDLNIPIVLTFKGPTPCNESLIWRQTLDPTRKFYFTTGGVSTLPIPEPFFITKRDKSLKPMYELQFSPTPWGEERFNVGIHKDGLLGITEHPTTVYFKKAFNVLELPTS